MQRFFSYTTKGSVMGLVLTITMLITLLCSLFILKSGMDSQMYWLYDKNDKAINNVESGLQLLLSNSDIVPNNSSVWLDLFDKGHDSVFLQRKSWGVFEIISSLAFTEKKQIIKTALIGARFTNDTTPLSLFVCDLGKALSVCGKTKLSGTCYVPKAGFKRAYIEGQSYNGDHYVYGKQLSSKSDLPDLNKSFVNLLQEQFKNPIAFNDSVFGINNTFNMDSIVHSFDQKTLVLESKAPVHLSAIYISGNVKIIAPKIIIDQSASLHNVLLFANEIEIKKNVSGEFQAMAAKKIQVQKEVQLYYPSQLIVFDNTNSTEQTDEPDISVDEDCQIIGDIICYRKQITHHEPYLRIAANTTIYGNVYVNGKLDIKSNIYGSTYCQKFYLKTNSGIYENHLLNAQLDASKLPKHYLGAGFLESGNKKEVLVWF